MLYEIEKECLSALCQMRNKLPELFNPTVSKMDLFLRQKVDLGHTTPGPQRDSQEPPGTPEITKSI